MQPAAGRAEAGVVLPSAATPGAFPPLLSHLCSVGQRGPHLRLHTQSTAMATTATAASTPAPIPVISTTSELPEKHEQRLP